MATTNVIYEGLPQANHYLGSNPAIPEEDGDLPVFTFDDTTVETLELWFRVKAHYGDGDLQTRILWASDTDVSGNVKFEVQYASVTPGTDSPGSKAFATAQSVEDAAGAAKRAEEAIVTHTKAQADGLAVNDWVKLRIKRVNSGVTNNIVGDVLVYGVNIQEA